jgi:hypothetical protein
MQRTHSLALALSLAIGVSLAAPLPTLAGQTQVASLGQLQSALTNAPTELASFNVLKNGLHAKRITFFDAGPLEQSNATALDQLLADHTTDVTTVRAALRDSDVLGGDPSIPGNPPTSMERYLKDNGLSVDRFVAVHVTTDGNVDLFYK